MRLTNSALAGAAFVCFSATAYAAPVDDQAHASWRDAIANTPVPAEGCFKADYPDKKWTAVACVKAPDHQYRPRAGHIVGQTVGNGNDYSAVVKGILSSTKGSFPTVTGVTSEKGLLSRANTYSIQLNSQFFSSAACAGAAVPSSCLGWQQFVFANENGGSVFMQYWLINYNATCPTGWNTAGSDCYINSASVSTPNQTINQLSYLKVQGTAVANGIDTMVFTTAKSAYSTTGKDSVVYLADSWDASEFNIVGDGDGSAAKFNKGSSITVNIALTDGSTAAPVCEPKDGTTGETNNLTLGKCTVTSGSTPAASFVESN